MVHGSGGHDLRIFKTKVFTRFARRERISDAQLREAVARAERGLVDADLGGGVVKQRVARPGQGRSGGFRALIAYVRGLGRCSYLALPRAHAAMWTTMSF